MTLEEMMLQDYYPGKYALHTRFQDYYPSFPYAAPDVAFLPLQEFAQEIGIDPEGATSIRGAQPKNANDILINMMFTNQRMPYSLDANLSQVADLMLHEGAHVAERYIPQEEQQALTDFVASEWGKAETPSWIRGLLQRGYMTDPMQGWDDYYKTLWMEALSHAIAPGGYRYREQGWPPNATYKQVELPETFLPYLEQLQMMTRPTGF